MPRTIEISETTYNRLIELLGPEDTTGSFIARLINDRHAQSTNGNTSLPESAGTPQNGRASEVRPNRAKVKKGPHTKLRVKMGDREISRDTAADTFVDAIFAAGVDKVESLGLIMCGYPLVSHNPPSNSERGHKSRDGWYVMTHSSTREKKGFLDQIGQDLGTGWSVEIV